MKERQSPRAIVFDFGNVLASFDTGIFLRRLLPHSDLPLAGLSAAIYDSGLHREYEAGRISSDEFFSTARQRCALRLGKDDFFFAFTQIFTPIPETANLVRALSKRYRLGLLSNTNERHYEDYIRKCDVFPFFETVTVSHQVGALKPSEAIYRDALAKLRLPPGECVYIDDVPEFVAGAQAVGLRGIRFENSLALAAALRRMGIAV